MTKEEEDGFLVDLDSMKKLSIKPINELVNPLVFIRQISLVEEDNQVNDQEPDDLLQITALELMAILQKSLYQRMFTQTSILQANFKYVDNLDVKQSSYDPAILQYKYFTTSQSFNKILIQVPFTTCTHSPPFCANLWQTTPQPTKATQLPRQLFPRITSFRMEQLRPLVWYAGPNHINNSYYSQYQIKQVVTKYFTHIEYLPYDKKSGQIVICPNLLFYKLASPPPTSINLHYHHQMHDVYSAAGCFQTIFFRDRNWSRPNMIIRLSSYRLKPLHSQQIKFKINFGPQYVVVQCSIFIVSYQQKLVCFDKVEVRLNSGAALPPARLPHLNSPPHTRTSLRLPTYSFPSARLSALPLFPEARPSVRASCMRKRIPSAYSWV